MGWTPLRDAQGQPTRLGWFSRLYANTYSVLVALLVIAATVGVVVAAIVWLLDPR